MLCDFEFFHARCSNTQYLSRPFVINIWYSFDMVPANTFIMNSAVWFVRQNYLPFVWFSFDFDNGGIRFFSMRVLFHYNSKDKKIYFFYYINSIFVWLVYNGQSKISYTKTHEKILSICFCLYSDVQSASIYSYDVSMFFESDVSQRQDGMDYCGWWHGPHQRFDR